MLSSEEDTLVGQIFSLYRDALSVQIRGPKWLVQGQAQASQEPALAVW